MSKSTEGLICFAAVLFIAVTALKAGTFVAEILTLELSADSPCSHLEV